MADRKLRTLASRIAFAAGTSSAAKYCPTDSMVTSKKDPRSVILAGYCYVQRLTYEVVAAPTKYYKILKFRMAKDIPTYSVPPCIGDHSFFLAVRF